MSVHPNKLKVKGLNELLERLIAIRDKLAARSS